MRRTWLAGVVLGIGLAVGVPLRGAPAPDPREAVRTTVCGLLMRLAQPLSTPPAAGRAWVCELRVTYDKHDGRALIAWDAAGRQAVQVEISEMGAAAAGFTPEASWLHVPKHDVLFRGTPAVPATGGPLAASPLWPVVKGQAAVALFAAALAPLPDNLQLAAPTADTVTLEDGRGRWAVEISGLAAAAKPSVRVLKPQPGELRVLRWEQTAATDLTAWLTPPAAGRTEAVDDADLRAMCPAFVDLLCERLLASISPALLPNPFPGLVRQQGKAVVVLRGSPAEIGRQYGTQLGKAVVANVHRIRHGVGLVRTLETGRWLPADLAATWQRQQALIPKPYIEEMDALAAAVDLPRDWVRTTNVFPEMFHCSGVALRGTATRGGQLLHGRILDYMTEAGLQHNAVITVVAPEGRHAWLNVGYAGCIGTVTAMNDQGLAVGEMGGRGEGHLDGMPMTFLLREVMERFDTVQEALAWMKATPRTCEYFYVLSEGRSKDMAGVASYAASLAEERGSADFEVVLPGAAHPLLPRPVPDAVLMSAGGRYQRLVDRVQAQLGQITPDSLWQIMGEGVAMRSALHIALFQPETLEVWVADAGPRAQPAYTQPVAKFNLRRLLDLPAPVAVQP